ncbi:hypothetical protein MRX96_045852 [Rhipicephalus microplus]
MLATATGCEPGRHQEWRPPRPPKRQVVRCRRSLPLAEEGTEAVRSHATRARTRKSAVPSRKETSQSSPSNEGQEKYIDLVLSRLLRIATNLGLGVPAKKEAPRCAAHKFIYSAAMLRSLNVHNHASTPAS